LDGDEGVETMSFEEEFPSLKNTGINEGLSDVEKETKKLVVKHCLDKQRVLRAINNNDFVEGFDTVACLEELGLTFEDLIQARDKKEGSNER